MAQREFLGGQSMRKRLSAVLATAALTVGQALTQDRKSTRLNSSHSQISYAVFCLKKKSRPPGNLHAQLDRALGRRRGDRVAPLLNRSSPAALADSLAFVISLRLCRRATTYLCIQM